MMNADTGAPGDGLIAAGTPVAAVVIPAYNEARTIRDVALQAAAQLPLVIVVDDGSSDGTAAMVEGLPVVLLRNDANLGKAGSVVMFNNQVWHRGGPNTSQRTRYLTQITYGRRMIGHKYFPFMNYVMPEQVYADADPRRRRLLGFLERGAYG